MAKNVVREAGEPIYGTTKNQAATKTSGQLIKFPQGGSAADPVALLTQDATSGQDGVSCILGGVVVRYTGLSAETADPGTVLYFDPAADKVTTVSTSNWRAGRCAKSKLNGETTIDVYLNMP